MKLVSRDVSGKDGAGTVVLRPEEPEDMWHVYNLIGEGDLVRTTTFRKVGAWVGLVRFGGWVGKLPACLPGCLLLLARHLPRCRFSTHAPYTHTSQRQPGGEGERNGVDDEQQDPAEPDDRGGARAVRPGHVRAAAEREEP